jgi:hypothetical protein
VERELTLLTTLEWVHSLRELPLQLKDQRLLPRVAGKQPVDEVPPIALAPGGDGGGASPALTAPRRRMVPRQTQARRRAGA